MAMTLEDIMAEQHKITAERVDATTNVNYASSVAADVCYAAPATDTGCTVQAWVEERQKLYDRLVNEVLEFLEFDAAGADTLYDTDKMRVLVQKIKDLK